MSFTYSSLPNTFFVLFCIGGILRVLYRKSNGQRLWRRSCNIQISFFVVVDCRSNMLKSSPRCPACKPLSEYGKVFRLFGGILFNKKSDITTVFFCTEFWAMGLDFNDERKNFSLSKFLKIGQNLHNKMGQNEKNYESFYVRFFTQKTSLTSNIDMSKSISIEMAFAFIEKM